MGEVAPAISEQPQSLRSLRFLGNVASRDISHSLGFTCPSNVQSKPNTRNCRSSKSNLCFLFGRSGRVSNSDRIRKT